MRWLQLEGTQIILQSQDSRYRSRIQVFGKFISEMRDIRCIIIEEFLSGHVMFITQIYPSGHLHGELMSFNIITFTPQLQRQVPCPCLEIPTLYMSCKLNSLIFVVPPCLIKLLSMQQFVLSQFLWVQCNDVHCSNKGPWSIHGGGWSVDHLNGFNIG